MISSLSSPPSVKRMTPGTGVSKTVRKGGRTVPRGFVGSGKNELGDFQTTLEAIRHALTVMNGQFAQTKNALGVIIVKAERVVRSLDGALVPIEVRSDLDRVKCPEHAFVASTLLDRDCS